MHDHAQDHPPHSHQTASIWQQHGALLAALVILLLMLVLEYGFQIRFQQIVEFIIYAMAYMLAGRQVVQLAFRKASHFDFFNEFVLMTVATLGAFALGAYSEGVAVMVFYSIGEWFQDAAVDRAKRGIKALLDVRPDTVTVLRNGQSHAVNPQEVNIDEVIQVKAGEKVALDGVLLSVSGTYNTAAMTGESKPDVIAQGGRVLAGMISLQAVTEIKVQALFRDSKLSRILEMVQDATARKSQTQLFISRFAKVYTPIVFLLAFLVATVPYFLFPDYSFQQWFYRALVFLVISCPCALVVSIPLGYFGGIGLASRNGILFKGSNYLDVMTKVDTVVMDKTGTLTKGVFKVQKVVSPLMPEAELITLVAGLESQSTHPVALAIQAYHQANAQLQQVEGVEETAGQGLRGRVNGRVVLAGNTTLLHNAGIPFDAAAEAEVGTLVMVAVDQQYAGYLVIADEIKKDAAATISKLNGMGIHTVLLSGDRSAIVDAVAGELGIRSAFGALLPEQKVEKLQMLKNEGRTIAFAGDGINDAPVIALADVGMAMGGLGSDAAIETADVVIQNDQPSKILTAIKVGKLTRQIVWQNIALAMGVKILVLLLGASGVATLWEAVIADVGVALLAILNAVRIQRFRMD